MSQFANWLIANFKDSDLVKLLSAKGTWTFHVDVPLVDDIHGAFESPVQCVPKPVGPLSVTLLPSELDLNLPFDIPAAFHMVGSEAGVDANGNPLVRWELHQALGITIPRTMIEQELGIALPSDVTIDRIDGDLLLVLDALDRDEHNNPKRIPGDRECGGPDCHEQAVRFRLSADQPRGLIIAGHMNIVTAKVTADLQELVGITSAPVKTWLMVLYSEYSYYCGIVAVEGMIQHFTVSAINWPAGGPPQIQWDVFGATILPSTPTDQHWFEVVVPNAPGEYTVTVTVTFGLCVLKERLSFTAISQAEADQEQFHCRQMQAILGYIQVNKFGDPLGPDNPLASEEMRLRLRASDVVRTREVARRVLAVTENGVEERTRKE